jgi:hypothetical protein
MLPMESIEEYEPGLVTIEQLRIEIMNVGTCAN